jgi:hypothetical protein
MNLQGIAHYENSSPCQNVIKQAFNAQNEHPFFSYYNKTFTPSSRNRMFLNSLEIEKFKNKIELRRLCLEEEILPMIKKPKVEEGKSVYKLANIIEKTNKTKGIRTNKIDLIKEINREIFISNKEKEQLASQKEMQNKLKEKEIDLKTHNLTIVNEVLFIIFI